MTKNEAIVTHANEYINNLCNPGSESDKIIHGLLAEVKALRKENKGLRDSALDWAKRAGESQAQLNKVVDEYEAKLVTCEQGVRVEGTVESENSAIGFIQALDTLLVAYIGQRVTVIVLPEEDA